MAGIAIKRAYEPPAREDGCRVLVDRIWPRGLSRAQLAIDAWMKDLAPGSALRKWYGHDRARWPAFRERYFRELDERHESLARLRALCAEGPVTLVFAARDVDHSNASALRDYLLRDGERS